MVKKMLGMMFALCFSFGVLSANTVTAEVSAEQAKANLEQVIKVAKQCGITDAELEQAAAEVGVPELLTSFAAVDPATVLVTLMTGAVALMLWKHRAKVPGLGKLLAKLPSLGCECACPPGAKKE